VLNVQSRKIRDKLPRQHGPEAERVRAVKKWLAQAVSVRRRESPSLCPRAWVRPGCGRGGRLWDVVALVDVVRAVRKWFRPGGDADVTSVRASAGGTKPSGKTPALRGWQFGGGPAALPDMFAEKLGVVSSNGTDPAEESLLFGGWRGGHSLEMCFAAPVPPCCDKAGAGGASARGGVAAENCVGKPHLGQLAWGSRGAGRVERGRRGEPVGLGPLRLCGSWRGGAAAARPAVRGLPCVRAAVVSALLGFQREEDLSRENS